MSDDAPIHSILSAFTHAEILASISFDPDGSNFEHVSGDTIEEIAAQLVERAAPAESVVIELLGFPNRSDDGALHCYFTMREQIPQARVAGDNSKKG